MEAQQKSEIQEAVPVTTECEKLEICNSSERQSRYQLHAQSLADCAQ